MMPPKACYIVIYTREVKTFPTKTSRDVGKVPSVSKEHMCLHGKINWRKKLQEQGGVPFHAQQSRLTFSGIKDTLDTCSPSLHLATSVVVYMHML